MGWRPREIWLDTDVLWFREQVVAGPAAALTAPAFPSFPLEAVGLRTGLAESRVRRAELRRRRNAKRTRTAALVIGPAVALSVAAPRLAGARGGGGLAEDPPSLTFTRGSGRAGADAATIEHPAEGAAATAPVSQPAPEPVPTIEWREATSHGLQYSGSLSSGTQLPVEGPDWVTWNPVEDRVPNRPGRLYGNERTIRAVLAVAAAYRAAHPDAAPVLVGDISFAGGGPMEQHRSHQNGLDVDIYYPRLDGVLRAPVTKEQIDRRLAQDLVDRFVAAGAKIVFVGYSIGLRGPSEVVVPYPNHGDHMHVRFPQPG
jgi:murein endopeptidase